MKILVTGSSGLVGKHLVEYLGAAHTVAGLSGNSSPWTQYAADITDGAEVRRVLDEFKPDAIVHAAAFTWVDGCEEQQEKAYRVNVEGTRNFAQWAKGNGRKMVYISTDYVYAGKADVTYDENSPTEPVNYAGKTKLEAEKETLQVENSAVLRTTVVYGYDPGGKNFLMQMLEAKKKKPVPTDQTNNPTDANLVCQYVSEVIKRDLRGIYNATGPETIGRYEFAKKIIKAFDLEPDLFVPVTTDKLKQAAKRPMHCKTTSRKLQELTGITPPSVEESLQKIKQEMNSPFGMERRIFAFIAEYYDARFGKAKFKPGEQVLNASTKNFDSEELIMGAKAVLDGWWTEGRFAREFEQRFADFFGVKYVTLTNSGSSANLVALMSLTSPMLKERALKAGDEVITVAAGFPTTVNPILQAGCVPVFVDIDLETLNIDVSKLEQARSEKTKVVMVAHTLGNPFDLDAVTDFCKKHNLWLIEDSCDALGATWNGRKVGTFGDMATFSFYPAHQMTQGEGGAVITNGPLLHRINDSFRDWGRDCWCEPGKDNTCGARFSQQFGKLPFGYDHKFVYSHLGYNLKLTDMQAAIGLAQLKKVPSFVQARRQNKKKLLERLGRYSEYFIFQEALPAAEPSWFGFVLTVREGCGITKDEIVKFLDSKKINTRPVFAGNLVRQPYFEGRNYRVAGELKNTDYVMHNTFWVCLDPSMTREKTDYLVGAFDEFFESKKR